MFKAAAILPFLVSAALTSTAKADAIPYPAKGTIAPEVPTFATGNGINAYFYGSTAKFTDYVRVYDVKSGYNSGDILNNKTTAVGTKLVIGAGAGQISAGDQLIFYIKSPQGLFASAAAYSDDKVNHGYVTLYTGGKSGIPAGLFVGLEDERNGQSDFNYNDDTFVFTGVQAPAVAATPEPSSLALLGTGLLSVAGVARRYFPKA